MDFSDEEIAEIIENITELCSKLKWSMRVVSTGESANGIDGIILGSDQFITDIGIEGTEVPDSEMH